jgi:tetratricopeptide (TPR) repeat protein
MAQDEKPKGLSRRELLFGMGTRLKKYRDERLAEFGGEDEDEALEAQSRDPVLEEADRAMGAGEWERAVEAFRRYLAYASGDGQARSRLGYCLYRLGRLVQCECEFNMALRQGPSNLASLYLGLAAARRGRMDKAVKAWKNYYNPEEASVQREINVQIALVEAGEEPDGRAVADEVEAALEDRRRQLWG